MDRVIPKRPQRRKYIFLSGIAVAAAALILYLFSAAGRNEVNVDKDHVVLATVQYAEFNEYIPVDGIVLPVRSIYLDAVEGGRVSEKYVQDGDFVTAGQPVLKLINTDLQLDFLNRETQAFDLINNLQNARNTLENNKVNRLTQLADVEFQLREAERVYQLNEKLFADKVVSQQEYLQSKNSYTYYKNKKALIEHAIVRDSITAFEQMNQMRESYARMRSNLLLMKQKTEDLVVRAPASGQLSSFTPQIGELKTKGQNLGQLDVMDGYKVRAQIDEHYISRIQVGQQAEFDYTGGTYILAVKTIYPQVANGRFDADMEFVGKQAGQLRKGQNLQLRLKLGDNTQALLLKKGGFYQSTGGNWVYVLEPGKSTATRRSIRTGRQNPQYYEILEGLKEGDQVIISSYETIGHYDHVNLKS